MLGFYDYTVILTYLSLFSALVGMFFTFSGHLHLAIFCLALCGLFDTFDGKVARTKKDRTEQGKRFGIQIDSLCDMVCFGVYPVIICYFSGMCKAGSFVILAFYCLAGLIRLAYFNVMEEERQQQTEEKRKYYQGLPITSISVILPLIYVSSALYTQHFVVVLHVVMLVTGLLFILDFPFRKPTNKQLALLIVVVAAAVVYITVFNWQWRAYFRLAWEDIRQMFSRSR